MPTYDYKCSECGHIFEELQSISANPLVTCPKCGKDGLKRIFATGAGMIFKGQGFYLTDYKKQGEGTGTTKGGSPEKQAPSSTKKTEPEPSKPKSDQGKKES